MDDDTTPTADSNRTNSDKGTSRRSVLKALGTTGLGAVALGGAAGVAEATDFGTPWSESYGSYGLFEDSQGHTHYRDIQWVLYYFGSDDNSDTISHHIGLGMVSHTYTASTSPYGGSTPEAGNQYQDGSLLKVYRSDETTWKTEPNATRPGYVDVSGGTDPNWSEVIEQNGDSISQYETEVEQQVSEDGGSQRAQKIFSYVAGEALGAITGGLGSAFGLAQLIFDLQKDGCGYSTTYGDPFIYDWDFCNNGYDNRVPLNYQHAVFEYEVPYDYDTHQSVVSQEVVQGPYNSAYGTDDSMQWGIRLPGYRDEPFLKDNLTLTYSR